MEDQEKNNEIDLKEKAFRKLLRVKKLLLVLVAILILFIILGGGSGYKLHKKFLNSEIKKTDSIQKVLNEKDIFYQLQFSESIDSVKNIYSQRKDYFDEMLKYKFKYEKSQKQIALIVSMRFNQRYLDSLANNVKFK